MQYIWFQKEKIIILNVCLYFRGHFKYIFWCCPPHQIIASRNGLIFDSKIKLKHILYSWELVANSSDASLPHCARGALCEKGNAQHLGGTRVILGRHKVQAWEKSVDAQRGSVTVPQAILKWTTPEHTKCTTPSRGKAAAMVCFTGKEPINFCEPFYKDACMAAPPSNIY